MQKLQKIFAIWLALMVLTLGLYALFGPKGKKIDLTEISFSTTNSSQLYFKNMRSYFYDKELKENGNYTLYRIDSREKDSLLNKLNVVLVMNSLSSQCFVRFESSLLNLDNRGVSILWEKDQQRGTIELSSEDSDGHYIFAAELFQQLESESQIDLIQGNDTLRLKESEKKSLRKSLNDYFKLVGKIR